MMGGNLEQLSRDLALSSSQPHPEEYIRKTLRAHGFFTHAQNRTADQSDASAVPRSPDGNPKGGKRGCGISEEDKKKTTQLVSHYKEGKEFHTLKEPRNLFSHPASKSQKNLPLWPAEVDCLALRTKFLHTPPPSPEPFYSPPHEIVSPKIRSIDGGGTIIYTNMPGPEKYFTRARAGPSVTLKAPPTRPPNDTTLIFESRFESGNLGKAVQVGRWDYELYLRFDLYTNKHTQWFFFSVRNMRAGQTYRLTIVNLYKAGSLYNDGMQPVTYSEANAKARGVGWRRGGYNIKYFKTPIRRQDVKQEVYYYGMSWSHTFQHANDTCYFAHCFPYTYSDMQDYLHTILSDPGKAAYCKQRTLCHTIAGNPVPLLTITSPVLSPEENKAKRAVVVTARVHPGETNGSWMMKGLIDFLAGSSPDANVLREMFVFKIVPMLNPDGVIVGNYRCSLAGRDLNRNYRTKLKDAYPTVWHTKAMVKRLAEEREVVVFCDLHGHSKKQNIFIYGCDDMADPNTRLCSRVFPMMLSKNAPTKFSYKSSKFAVQRNKEGTGRVVMWREMGVRNSYTMEATFCGSVLGRQKGLQFSTADLTAMGFLFCDTLLDYCDPDQTKVERILRDLEEDYRRSILERLAALGREVPPGVDPLEMALDSDLCSDSSNGGSDSSDSDGPPVHVMAKSERKKKRKKLKSRKERNKQKALLKLTHHKTQPPPHPPPHTQLPPALPNTENPREGGAPSRKNSLDVTPYRYNPLEAARNGGIPIFIQERIEERQKKRSDFGSSERLSDEVDYVEAVVMEYIRQGVPQGALQEASARDPRSSTSLLPRPQDCPMNISAVQLCESRRQTSRTFLPQIDPPLLPATEEGPYLLHVAGSGSHAAFASHYVAHHLQDIVASPSGTNLVSGGPQNSTRNLTNLSKLFRQLRPHLLQGKEGRAPIRTTSRPELKGQLQPEEEEEEQEERDTQRLPNSKPTRIQFYSTDKDGMEGVCSGEYLKTGGERERVVHKTVSPSLGIRQGRHLDQLALKGGKLVRTVGEEPRTRNLNPDSSSNSEQLGRLTSQNVVAELHSSYSSLSKNGHLTSSWESFTQPAHLSEREREGGRSQDVSPLELKEPPEASIDVRLPDKLSQPIPSHYDTLLKTLGREGGRPTRLPATIPKSLSAPDQTTRAGTMSFDENPPPQGGGEKVRVHKQRIADAVESVQRRRKLFRHREPVTQRGHLDHIPNTHPETQFPRAPRPERAIPQSHSEPYTSTNIPPVTHYPHTPHTLTHNLDDRPVTVTEGSWQRYVTGGGGGGRESAMERYVPVATSWIYSSKPASRYGRRPTADCGVPPATVSLMLAGSGKVKRPSTMYSSRKPKPLHVKYYTKKSNTFFID